MTMSAMYRHIGKTPEQVECAQQMLVNTTIHFALEKLYAHVREDDKTELCTKLHVYGRDLDLVNRENHPCQTADEAMEAILREFPDEFDRVRAYNQLAKANHFDFSIKSSGCKQADSFEGKQTRRQLRPEEISDVVRLTVVSTKLERLDSYLEELRGVFRGHHPSIPMETPPKSDKIKPWQMNNTAVLKHVLNTKVDNISAEIQAVPRHQARLATRISHTFYEIVRGWSGYCVRRDAYLAQKEELSPIRQAKEEQAIAQERHALIDRYNGIVAIMNDMVLRDELPPNYLAKVNKRFASNDMNSMTFDEDYEGGEHIDATTTGNPHYSDIFKTMKDVDHYREYLRLQCKELFFTKQDQPLGNGKRGDVYYGTVVQPLPLSHASHDEADDAISKKLYDMQYCAQMTHACYMRQAPKEMRALWVNKALDNVSVSSSLVDHVAQVSHEPHDGLIDVDALLAQRRSRSEVRGA